MSQPNVYGRTESFENRSLSVEERDDQHNLPAREHSESPPRQILPFNRAAAQDTSSICPPSDDSLIPSSAKNSVDRAGESRKMTTGRSSEVNRPDLVGLSGSLPEEPLYRGQAASIRSAPPTRLAQPDATRDDDSKINTTPSFTPVPKRKNSRTFSFFKKEIVSPFLNSSRTPISSFLSVDSRNKERQQQGHNQQGRPYIHSSKDKPSGSSTDISSFSFPNKPTDKTGGGSAGHGKKGEAEEAVSTEEADLVEEIGQPFDVRHALHVESDDLAVLPLEWVDALKAQGSTPAEILQLAVSKSKSHMLRQKSINLPIPVRPKSPPLPPLPHPPTSPPGRHSRSNSFAPARSWAPLSGGRTENMRSKLAKRMTKSNSLLFGSSFFGGPRNSSDLLTSPSETALDDPTSSTPSDVTPVDITSPIIVSRKSCVILSPSLLSSPSPSSSSTSPSTSPQSTLNCLPPHTRTSSIPLMSPRLSVDFDVGSFQVPFSPLGPEYSIEQYVLKKTDSLLSPEDGSSETSTPLTASHRFRSSSFLSFSSSASGSSSSERSPLSVHLSTPGQTHPSSARPVVQTSTPSVYYQADTSGWPQPEFTDVRGLSGAALVGSGSALDWEEPWDQGRRDKRASSETDEYIDSAATEERHIGEFHPLGERGGNSQWNLGGLSLFGKSSVKDHDFYQVDRANNPSSIEPGRPLPRSHSQTKSKRSSTKTSYSNHSSSCSVSSADSSQEAVISKAVLVRNTFLVSDVTVSNLPSA